MASRWYPRLLIAVVIGASWAAYGTGGGVAALFVLLALAIHLRAGDSHWRRSLHVAAAFLWSVALACLLLPAVNAAVAYARNWQCMNNLKEIGLGLRNYRDVFKSYPPPCTYDATGRALHSWRVYVTNFVSCDPRFAQCDLRKPWNEPNNWRVLDERWHIYQCPMDQATWRDSCADTNYLTAVGGRVDRIRYGMAGGDSQRRERPSDAFVVIEMAHTGIHWAEPKDIDFDDPVALQALTTHCLHTRDNGYFFRETPAINAVLLEGDMMFLLPCYSPHNVLEALLPSQRRNAQSSEDVDDRDKRRLKPNEGSYDLYTEDLRLHWPHCIGLPVWMVAVGLLLAHARRRRGGGEGSRDQDR